jgi:hypothetical protein
MTKPSSVASQSTATKGRAKKPGAARASSQSSRPPRPPASSEAQRRAAAVLEVLAGVVTPPEAAAALGLSVNGYYLLERKALGGLAAACEPQPKGRSKPGLEQQVAAQQREVERLRRECQRQAALVRATQRAVGLPAATPPKTAGKKTSAGGKGRRRRKPTVRALRAAGALRKTALASERPEGVEPWMLEGAAESPSPGGACGVAPSGSGASSQDD